MCEQSFGNGIKFWRDGAVIGFDSDAVSPGAWNDGRQESASWA